MHFEWNIYVRFELESWRNILWCPPTYVRIEQTSEAIRVTHDICRAGGQRGLELTTAEVDHLIIEGMENLEVKQGILGNLRNFIFLWKPIFFSILWWIELKRTAFIWNKKNFGNIINDFTLTFKKVFIYFPQKHSLTQNLGMGVYDCLVMIDSKTLYI